MISHYRRNIWHSIKFFSKYFAYFSYFNFRVPKNTAQKCSLIYYWWKRKFRRKMEAFYFFLWLGRNTVEPFQQQWKESAIQQRHILKVLHCKRFADCVTPLVYYLRISFFFFFCVFRCIFFVKTFLHFIP